MNKVFITMLGISCMGITACANNSQATKATDSNADTVAIVESVTEDAKAEKAEVKAEETPADFDQLSTVAKMIFAEVLPGTVNSDGFEEMVIAECTPSFIQALKDANDFDDGGLAWWMLRTMEQEGPDFDNNKVISVEPAGDNSVIVNYYDMGLKASTRLDFVKVGDQYKVNSATVNYNGNSWTVK